MTTDILSDYTPEDADVIRKFAAANATVYSLILPSGRPLTGDEANPLIEALRAETQTEGA